MTADDPDREARLAEIAEHKARQNKLSAEHGKPEWIAASDALTLGFNAGVITSVTSPSDYYASIYRDSAAADAWLESNLTHNGHPTLARFALPDGRVVGILDLRPALAESRKRAEEDKP